VGTGWAACSDTEPVTKNVTNNPYSKNHVKNRIKLLSKLSAGQPRGVTIQLDFHARYVLLTANRYRETVLAAASYHHKPRRELPGRLSVQSISIIDSA
jgi:hypothetical protein